MLRVSALEVYNETVRDLLAADAPPLDVRVGAKGPVFVQGLTGKATHGRHLARGQGTGPVPRDCTAQGAVAHQHGHTEEHATSLQSIQELGLRAPAVRQAPVTERLRQVLHERKRLLSEGCRRVATVSPNQGCDAL